MATIRKFEDLEIWQLARVFCQDIYKITKYENFSKDFRLTGQITASSGSVMDNIAEGFGRGGNKEFSNEYQSRTIRKVYENFGDLLFYWPEIYACVETHGKTLIN